MIKKCMWCNKENNDLIWLYEVHGQPAGEPQVICREHIIPGEDPCPVKQYRLEEDGRKIRRVWLENEELKQSIVQRYSWFEDHPCELTR